MDEEAQDLSFDELVDKFSTAEPKFVEPVEPPEDDDQEVEQEEASEDDAEDEEQEEGSEDGSDSDSEDQGEEEAEAEVEVEGTKVRVSELASLYKEREQLTQRTQAANDANRVVEAQGLFLAKIYGDRLTTAKANAERYAKVDLFTAFRELETDEFETLKAAKEAAEAELATVTSEASSFMQSAQNTKREYLRAQAVQSIGAIRAAIPDWSDELYGKVRTYAVAQGMDPGTANEIVDASAIIMMHKAMLYDNAKTKSETVTKKVIKAPKKVVKKSDTTTDSESSKQKRLMTAARASGDIDDVTNAFLAARR